MSRLEQYAEHIAEALLNIEAVSLSPKQPFTWTSGIKSPIYCDNRLTMSYPDIRNLIAEGFAVLIAEKFSQTEVIAGTATAGIPHAAFLAQKVNLPMIYVRDKAKGHGKQNQIEGALKDGQKVLVIEDLISTGGSSIKAAQAVQEAGGQALGVGAIFTYELDRAVTAFHEANIELQTLSNYSTLIQVALRKGIVQEEDLSALQAWRANPSAFGQS